VFLGDVQGNAENMTNVEPYQDTKAEVIRHALRRYYATDSRKEGNASEADASTRVAQSPAGEACPHPPGTRPQIPQIRRNAEAPADLLELAGLWTALPEALRAGFLATAKALGGQA
jgi:hypothetical protein